MLLYSLDYGKPPARISYLWLYVLPPPSAKHLFLHAIHFASLDPSHKCSNPGYVLPLVAMLVWEARPTSSVTQVP